MAVDEDIRAALDRVLPSWKGVTSRRMFGGVAYMVGGKMFCVLMDGTLGMKLPDELRARALGFAGVSPFVSPSGGRFGQWVQFLLLLGDNVPPLIPWIEAAFNHVEALPEAPRRSRGARVGRSPRR